MTLCRDMETAPLASVEVMIMGSISGVRPTAMLIAKSRACAQSPFATPLIRKTMGTMTSIMRTKRLLTEETPRSKLVFARSPERDFAMDPTYVSSPVRRAIAVATPLTTLVPMNPIWQRSVRPASSFFSGALNFSTGLDSPVREAWATKVSLVVRKRTSAGSIFPADSRMISPGTTSEKGISVSSPSRQTSA